MRSSRARQGFISPQSFVLLLSILFLAAVVVGGQGNRWGVMVGAVIVAYLPERFRGFEEWRVLVFGARADGAGDLPAAGPASRRDAPCAAKQLEQEIEALEEGVEDRGAAHVASSARRARGGLVAASTRDRIARRSESHVTLRFGGLTALDEVSFHIDEGEILGLIGPNGAGKTTCFNVDHRRLPPDLGRGPVRGQDARSAMKRHQITKLGIARTFQNIRLFSDDDGAGERAGRRRRQPRTGRAQRAVPRCRATAARRRRATTEAMELLRFMGLDEAGRRARREPVLRRPAAAGDRPGDGDQAQAALPRRAGRRLQPG